MNVQVPKAGIRLAATDVEVVTEVRNWAMPNGWRFLLNKVEFQRNYSSDEFGFRKNIHQTMNVRLFFLVGVLRFRIA